MKNLKEHITEAWAGVKKQTYNRDIIAWCDEMGIEKYTINSNGEIDVDGNVRLKSMNIKELPYKFGTVNGYFDIGHNKALKSLKNCPDKVTGYFSCVDCNNLKSLEGAPEKLDGGFSCTNCSSLTSLVGVPKEVGGAFWCDDCTSLTSLEGTPEVVGGGFYCYDCKGKFTKEDVKKVCKVRGNIFV